MEIKNTGSSYASLLGDSLIESGNDAGKNSLLANSAQFLSVLLVVGFALVLFFSAFHLFDSPETWLDEGLIIQSVVGLLHTGKASLLVTPGVFEPAWYITTGFPLTIPLAGAFALFGVSLEVARSVMLVFLLIFYAVLFLYARRAIGGWAAWLGFFFLVLFAPVYGHGRNVLGEIPGLVFLLVSLLPLVRGEALTRGDALLVGTGAGLAFATKPIFILFLPALLLACVLRREELGLKKIFIFGVLGFLMPLMLWISTQFDNATLVRVLSVYANPHDVDIGRAIATNVKRLFTEMQPLYFLGALSIWTVSYAVRRFRREEVPLTEEIVLFFSILVFFAYLRSAGYYRYFFPAQVFAVLYLSHSVGSLVRGRRRIFLHAAGIFLCGLLLFQAYQTLFRSWTAVHYDSERTRSLERYFVHLLMEEELFVYQAPEIITFTGNRPIYQFVQITPSISAGNAYASRVVSGIAPRIITPTEFFQEHARTIFSRYAIAEVIDNYVMLEPKTVEYEK